MYQKILSVLCIGAFVGSTLVGAFPDVGPDLPYDNYPFYDAIDYLEVNEFSNGFSDGEFKPHLEISRGELMKLVIKAFGHTGEVEACLLNTEIVMSNVVHFPDVPIDHIFSREICVGYLKGFIRGFSDGLFKPDRNITVAEAVKVISNAHKGKDVHTGTDKTFVPYFVYLTDRKAIPVNDLGEGNFITREIVAEIIYRLREIIVNKSYKVYPLVEEYYDDDNDSSGGGRNRGNPTPIPTASPTLTPMPTPVEGEISSIIEVIPETTEISKGEEFFVDIKLDIGSTDLFSRIKGLQFAIGFDDSKLECLDYYDNGGTIDAHFLVNENGYTPIVRQCDSDSSGSYFTMGAIAINDTQNGIERYYESANGKTYNLFRMKFRALDSADTGSMDFILRSYNDVFNAKVVEEQGYDSNNKFFSIEHDIPVPVKLQSVNIIN